MYSRRPHYTREQRTGLPLSYKYTKEAVDPQFNIEFSEITGPSKIVYVEFKVKYSADGDYYTYYVSLTITNRQSIDVNYPEDGFVLTEGNFVLTDNEKYAEDGRLLSGLAEDPSYNDYIIV